MANLCTALVARKNTADLIGSLKESNWPTSLLLLTSFFSQFQIASISNRRKSKRPPRTTRCTEHSHVEAGGVLADADVAAEAIDHLQHGLV